MIKITCYQVIMPINYAKKHVASIWIGGTVEELWLPQIRLNVIQNIQL